MQGNPGLDFEWKFRHFKNGTEITKILNGWNRTETEVLNLGLQASQTAHIMLQIVLFWSSTTLHHLDKRLQFTTFEVI